MCKIDDLINAVIPIPYKHQQQQQHKIIFNINIQTQTLKPFNYYYFNHIIIINNNIVLQTTVTLFFWQSLSIVDLEMIAWLLNRIEMKIKVHCSTNVYRATMFVDVLLVVAFYERFVPFISYFQKISVHLSSSSSSSKTIFYLYMKFAVIVLFFDLSLKCIFRIPLFFP